MTNIDEELGFIIEEDQSDNEMPSVDGWQTKYNNLLFRGWHQGYKAQKKFPDMTVHSNPYTLDKKRKGELRNLTLALGWEDGFKAAERGDGEDECPYPES